MGDLGVWPFFVPIIVYQASFVLLWTKVARVRRSSRNDRGLPSALSLFLGTASLTYLWSDRHRDAGDASLSRMIYAVRVTQLGALVGMALFVVAASG